MPAGQVDAMVGAGPAPRHYDPASRPVLDLIRKLTARRDLAFVSLEKAGLRLELRRDAGRGAAGSFNREFDRRRAGGADVRTGEDSLELGRDAGRGATDPCGAA
jgi:hypothetical protein